MPTLAQLIQTTYEAQRDVLTVDVNRPLEWVSIRDSAGDQEEIFLQGDDARQFIDEATALWEEVQTCDYEMVYLHLAAPYAENLGG